ncbi:MAG: benzoate/H(+) symporter BenE family transporter [Chloroflexota bacterium]|nr:benzoate/H(+) symporter BenE family transporter [Chloroflexota bacterium]
MTQQLMRIPPSAPTLANVVRNLRDLPRSLTLSGVTAGFIIVLISYTGPLAIILQAAERAHFTPEQTASWVWAVVVGNGVATILMSLLYRQPLTSPYSTAGAALLTTSLVNFPLSEAIGAYILCAAALALLGVSGLFGRAMRLIPQPVVMAVLAGVLLRFGLGIFNRLPENPLLVVAMIGVFFALKRLNFRAPSLGAMVIGIVIAGAMGQLNFAGVTLTPTLPLVYAPTFTLNAALSLSLPLFALALVSQYATGLAVLRANGYDAPINGILAITGINSIVLALFGGHGNVLGALTAAIVVGPDSQPDPDKRYASAVASGVWHVVLGVFGTTIVALFAGFPPVFVSTIAGLTLSGVIGNSLAGALEQPAHRDAAVIAFLCTAGDFSLFGIGAPFWGLVAGVAVYAIMRKPG